MSIILNNALILSKKNRIGAGSWIRFLVNHTTVNIINILTSLQVINMKKKLNF